MFGLRLVLVLASVASFAFAQRPVSFPLLDHSAQVHADLYGEGTHALILAHGGRFDEKSWQRQAPAFVNAGFLVLALRFRGDTYHDDGSPSAEGSTEDNATDVLAALAYLHQIGANSVSAVGGSMGGDAVGEASIRSPGAISRIVFLASAGPGAPEKVTGRKLFIVARNDNHLPGISERYAKAPQPKKFVLLDGSAHAQYLFETAEGPRLLNDILGFLTDP